MIIRPLARLPRVSWNAKPRMKDAPTDHGKERRNIDANAGQHDQQSDCQDQPENDANEKGLKKA